jgi:hypothetical protein
MRRTYISPEFSYAPVNGTLSMIEKGAFFGSKMLQLSDTITIGTENIIWYQQSTNEQVSLATESALPASLYNTVTDKQSLQTITLNANQIQSQIDTNAAWTLQIQIGTLLSDYLFATLKKYRTFEGVLNANTLSNDVNTAINSYVTTNVVPEYQYSTINFYIAYNSLSTTGSLRFTNVFSSSVESPANIFTKITTSTDINNQVLTVTFNQEQPTTVYYFTYYFNIVYTRI